MMILKEGQTCPYALECPYNKPYSVSGPCHGTLLSRKNEFTCDYVVNGQIVEGGKPLIPGDKTGKMRIILD